MSQTIRFGFDTTILISSLSNKKIETDNKTERTVQQFRILLPSFFRRDEKKEKSKFPKRI